MIDQSSLEGGGSPPALLRRHVSGKLIADQKVIVVGPTLQWEATAAKVAAKGGTVVGFFDPFIHDQAGDCQGVPIINRKMRAELEALPVVYAGRPRKSLFTAAPPAPQRCYWLRQLDERQLAGRHTPDLLKDHSSELKQVNDALHDETSKQVYQSLIKGRVEGDSGYFRISPYHEYLHPIVSARRDDVVIDGGACEGDTTLIYSRKVGEGGRVISLEPSSDTYLMLCERVQREQLSNVLPLCLGLAGREGVLRFTEGVTGSTQLSEQGTTRVSVTTVDSLAHRLQLKRVDLIKLDVEGAEAEVLGGARTTIEKHRPLLQVSIYHRHHDLFELPLLLMNRLKSYAFFIGHHSFYHVESDLYCCPLERLAERQL